MTPSDLEVWNRVAALVATDLPRLPLAERAWTESDLASPPRLTTFASNQDGSGEVSLWLVTDHTGVRDANCRVVFDPNRESFGLVMDLQGDVGWFMGLYRGTFADVVMAI